MITRLYDWFARKVLRRYVWRYADSKVRVDCLPVEQFVYQREAAAARLRSMHEGAA